jgi:hypothetical protein
MLRQVVGTRSVAVLVALVVVGAHSLQWLGALLAVLLVCLAVALAIRGLSDRKQLRRREAERQSLYDRLRALVDDEGGLYDESLAAEAERGLRMLDRWRRTHSS